MWTSCVRVACLSMLNLGLCTVGFQLRAEDDIELFPLRATQKMAISSLLKVMKSHYPLFLSSDITTQEFPCNSRWHVPLLKSLPLTNSVWLSLCKWDSFLVFQHFSPVPSSSKSKKAVLIPFYSQHFTFCGSKNWAETIGRTHGF